MRYRFVDCRWSLVDPEAGRRAYLAAHVPGAAFLDLDTEMASAPGPGGRHPLPAPETFAAAAGRAGIDRDTHVVAYGSPGAERLWWLLRHFGHDDCSVLVGGIDAWGGALHGGEEEVVPAVFAADERTGDAASLDEIASRLDDPELVLVDTRVAARFRGEPNPIDVEPGRIPSSRNAPWEEPLPPLPDGDVIAYCGSGVTACVVLHRLWLAGRNGRLYPGSWSEWEQRPELPRVRG